MPSLLIFNRGVQINSLKFLATVGGGIFAGISIGISAVDVPARRELEPKAALTQWRAMFLRAKRVQASLALCCGLSSFAVGYLAKDHVWLVGGSLMVSMLPFTLLAIMPTNNKLLDTKVWNTKSYFLVFFNYLFNAAWFIISSLDGTWRRIHPGAHRILGEITSRSHHSELRCLRPIGLATALSHVLWKLFFRVYYHCITRGILHMKQRFRVYYL